MSTRTLFLLTGALLVIAGVVGLLSGVDPFDVVFVAVGAVFLALANQQSRERPPGKR